MYNVLIKQYKAIESSINWKLCSKNLVIQVILEKLFWLLSIFCYFFKSSIWISCFRVLFGCKQYI